MKWQDLDINGVSKCMVHLQPFEMDFDVAGQTVTVHFEFGFHCFTDDKGHGQLLWHRGEKRYFCPDRYECSKQLEPYIRKRFYEGKVAAFYSDNNQRFFCLDVHDYAIFFSISKPNQTTNRLKLRVVSAYDVATWGRSSLPRGKVYNVRYVLERRNAGETL